MELLFTDPYVYVSEVLGAVVVGALLAWLLVRRRLREFALTGRMDLIHRDRCPLSGGLADREERSQQVQGGQRPSER